MNTCRSPGSSNTQTNGCCNHKTTSNVLDLRTASQPENWSLQFQVTGANCGGCVTAIEQCLRETTGVTQAQMDLSSGIASVEGSIEASVVISVLEGAGYTATPICNKRDAT